MQEELITLFAEVQNIINSRPLTAVSSNIDVCHTITSNSLLHSTLDPSNPIVDPRDARAIGRDFQYALEKANDYWKKWMLYYLPYLQESQKNVLRKRNLAVGDLVIVTDQKTSCSDYPLWRIIKVEPEKSHVVEVVRFVVVRLANRNAPYPKSPMDCPETRRYV